MGRVAGVVLAAGASERMGTPKQNLPLGDRTVLGVTVAAAEASLLDRVIVVTGADADAVEERLILRRAVVVRNPDFSRGNLSSLLVGIGAAGEVEAIVHLLGDMPGVGPDLIDRFVDLWDDEHPWAAVARYQDGEGHPILLSQRAISSISSLTGPKALWRYLMESERAHLLDVVNPIPIDVDTPGDYERLVKEWERSRPE